jgi:hypothetical protein
MLAAIGQPIAKADHHRITKSFRQPVSNNVNAPLVTKTMMAVITTGKMNLALPCVSRSLRVEVLGGNQKCLASSAACFFPASIMSTARPSQLCSTVTDATVRTPMNRSQNST